MVRVPLPIAEVWGEMQAQVEELQILRAILEEEVTHSEMKACLQSRVLFELSYTPTARNCWINFKAFAAELSASMCMYIPRTAGLH